MDTQNDLPAHQRRRGAANSVRLEAERLAADPRLSDYDFWRSLKNLENRIFEITANRDPIPFDMVRWRAILKQARSKRGARSYRS
ncbi:hypothetical protein ASD50_06070 [Mesorhizobium sp. Root552]|jgi:hypothetical protein|uniref:hypothetical protein n=1 Tax=Mesorhizobium sp. Root552 TaxID=1736555 RepID=UPI0006FB192E|nr:hypothetical protein [Mesorhizobium sp. Root552]KQZ19076.1 hypothetical protein ASD50_06070 [Mesorhizobium sp. Root552]